MRTGLDLAVLADLYLELRLSSEWNESYREFLSRKLTLMGLIFEKACSGCRVEKRLR